MKLTHQQVNFIDKCSDGGSLALNSVAGSGKTFTLQEGAKVLKGGVATSFSKMTVDELKKKLPKTFESKTIHSIGLSTLKKHIKIYKIDSKDDKVFNIITAISKNRKLLFPVKNLVKAAQLSKIVINGENDTIEDWDFAADTANVDRKHIEIARKTLLLTTQMAVSKGIITFDDMLYIPYAKNYDIDKTNVMIIDEAQDLNALQHEMILKSLNKNGKVVLAGDPNQAIYGFAGALTNSYNDLVEKFNCKELALSVSFRCPKSVVRLAQRIVPSITFMDNAIEGDVIYHRELDFDKCPPVIICRDNKPLISLAMKFIIHGKTARVIGKDIGDSLIQLVRSITTIKTMSTANFTHLVEDWYQRTSVNSSYRIKALNKDRKETLQELCLYLDTVGDVEKFLTNVFFDPSTKKTKQPEFTLCTGHKSKGLEWDDVLFLDNHLIPSRFATTEDQLQQEENLKYVIITRAKRTLHFANSNGIIFA